MVTGKNALEPFLLLGKSCKGSASAIQLVEQAISSSSVFVFWELFQFPSISALETDSPATFRKLLLFSVGTISEYLASLSASPRNDQYSPPLTEQQIHKLRILSLVTLCTKSNVSLCFFIVVSVYVYAYV
jgi:hypothetical protein